MSVVVVAAAAPRRLSAPARFAAEAVSPYFIDAWTAEEGLPQNTVNAIAQTRDGFVWLATFGGLARFDGINFRTFTSGNTPGLGAERFLSLHEDRSGTLWIGSERDGLFMRRDGLFSKPIWHAKLPGREIRSIIETRDGALWIGTADGALRVDRPLSQQPRTATFTKANGLSANAVRAMAEAPDGSVWLGTYGGGLARVVAAGDTFKIEPFPTLRTFPTSTPKTIAKTAASSEEHALINTLAVDAAGVVWVGTQDGLFRISGVTSASDAAVAGITAAARGPVQAPRVERVQLPAIGSIVRALLPDAEGMWIAASEGLCRLASVAPAAPVPATSVAPAASVAPVASATFDRCVATIAGTNRADTKLSDTDLRALARDREDNLWIGTNTGGVNRLKRRRATPYVPDDGRQTPLSVLPVVGDGANGLWIGTLCGGLLHFHDDRFDQYSRAQGLPTECVSALHRDDDGTVWVGSFSRGLIRIDSDLGVTVMDVPHGLSDPNVRAIVRDRRGVLWVGTNDALNRLTEAGTFVSHRLPVSTARVTFIAESRPTPSSSPGFWLGTDGGLLHFNPDTGAFKWWRTTEGLSHNAVRAVLEDDDGTLWIGTYGGGLDRMKDRRITHYTTVNGLYDNFVSRILDDGRGSLWMTGNRGVFRVARADLAAVAEGRASRITSVWFDATDGMRISESNGGGQPAGWRSHDGRLWMPTIGGVVAFDPAAATNDVAPPVAITRILVDQREHDLSRQGELIVPAGTHNIEIHYAGLSFVSPRKVRFHYRLEGYDRDWIASGDRRIAYYTGLPPGDYQFEVRARNEDGVWSERHGTLGIRQLPRFHQTWQFSVLVFLLLTGSAAAAVYALHRIKLARVVALERMRMRIATDLHDDIGGTLSRMAIVSEVTMRDATVSPEVRRRLDDLGETARGIVDTMSDVVWSVDPRLDHLSGLLVRVRQHAVDVLDGLVLTFDVAVSPNADTITLSPDQRRHLYLLLKEALTNVAKHAHASHVRVSVRTDANGLHCEVYDNGRGLSPAREPALGPEHEHRHAHGRGRGLSSMQARAAAIGGRLRIDSDHLGTTVRVDVPLDSPGPLGWKRWTRWKWRDRETAGDAPARGA